MTRSGWSTAPASCDRPGRGRPRSATLVALQPPLQQGRDRRGDALPGVPRGRCRDRRSRAMGPDRPFAASSVSRCFAAHQRLIPLVTSYTVSSPEVMGMYDELAETLRATGVPDGQLLDVITMCDSIVLGAALDLAAPDEGWAVDQARSPALIAAIQQAGSVANGPTGRSRLAGHPHRGHRHRRRSSRAIRAPPRSSCLRRRRSAGPSGRTRQATRGTRRPPQPPPGDRREMDRLTVARRGGGWPGSSRPPRRPPARCRPAAGRPAPDPAPR